jgi:hypothetical protein
VQPCANCGHCTKRNPGRCATRDDGDWLYPKIQARTRSSSCRPWFSAAFPSRRSA